MPYETEEIGSILEIIASEKVAPAGGSVTAIMGAFGTSLVEMATIHSPDIFRHSMENAKASDTKKALLTHHRHMLLTLADADAETIEVMYAEEEYPSQAIVQRGTGIPTTIARSCTTVLEEAVTVAADIRESVEPDFVTGLYILRTAAITALRIVEGNLQLIENAAIRNEYATQTNAIRTTLQNVTDELEAVLANELRR